MRSAAVTGHGTSRVGRSAAAVALAVGLAGVLGGCSGDGVTLPSELPSELPSVSVPSELPSVSLPAGGGTEEPSESATAEPTTAPSTDAPTEEPTSSPDRTRTATVTQTAEPTAEPTQEPTQEPTPSASPSGDAAKDTTDQEDGAISPWWWVLLGLVVLGAVIWYLLARSARRRREQRELLEALTSRGRWAVDHGAGALIGAGDPAATQEAWSRLNATLVDMAAEVRTLAHQTPADQGGPVIALRDAVASLQGAAESHARARLSGDPSPTTAEAVFEARDRLSRALTALPPPTD